jgi:hypothetical protein
MIKQLFVTLFVVFIVMLSISVSAQDAHYWNQTYGTRSTLLGGAVIGSVDDLGATFYNPGQLSLVKDPNFLFSARVFEYQNISLKPDYPALNPASKSRLTPSPSFIVFNLSSDWLGKTNLAFSFLTRQTFDTRLKTRYVGDAEDLDVSNETLYEGNTDEYWGGITLSYPIYGKYSLGVGLTNYIAVRSYRSRSSINSQSIDSLQNVGILSGTREYEYYNVRILWKAGIGFTFESIRFGLTVTTPSINLFGSGETDINLNSSGVDIDGDNVSDEFLLSDYQEGLPSNYSSSFAIGLGIYYRFGDFKVHFSSEYYSKVSQFNVLASNQFQSQTGNFLLTNNLTHALKPIFNFGLGLEFLVSKKVTTFGAFVTDFSALDEEVRSNHSVSLWDFYHITGGASLTFEKMEVTFRLSLALAGEDIPIPMIPLTPSEEIDFIYQQQNAEISSMRIKLILGLTF